jgi:hypothetical protein
MPIEESEYSGCEFFTDKYVSKGKVSLCGIYQSKKVGTTTMKTFQFSAFKVARYVLYGNTIISVRISTNDNDINNNYNVYITR